MEPTRWEVLRRESYADGQTFGDFGAFEIVEGRVHYQVDPEDPRNAGIVDLDLAPRHDGMVRFSGDFTLVAPSERPAAKLFVDVPNRGRRLAFSMFNRASPKALLDNPCAPGDGFLFRRGFAVASIGWQWDAPGLRLDAPIAARGDSPIDGDVVCRIQPGSDRPFVPFGQLGEVAYPPAYADDAQAHLFVRDDDAAPQVELPRETWRFGKTEDGQAAPESSAHFIHKDGGFEKGRIYTLVYRARHPRVVGCGLLALRDAAASLRCGAGPCRGFEQVLGFGASQTGRVLRHLLHLGLNSDADGKRVFDGLHIHIAGGQRGDFNHRFAQPSSAGVAAAGQRFPFAGTTMRDPLTGAEDGLYRRVESIGAMPKVVATNTSWEYWRGDAALIHVAPDGSADLAPHPRERCYLFAGTHHIGGVLPPTNVFALTGEKARHTFNVVDHSPLTRAALMNLSRWVDGLEPPSAVPTLAAGTLVERSVVMRKFADAGGFHCLDTGRLGGLAALELGPRAEQGICSFPAQEGKPYARLVADVDESLNEVAGIRLPDIAVPVGCHTGWNPRHPSNGAPDLAAIFVGFTRFASPDSLPPADEYERRVRAWTRHLVAERFLLEEDFETVVANCMARYRIARRSGADGEAP